MKISHKLHVRVDVTQFYYYDGLQPKMRAGITNEHECILLIRDIVVERWNRRLGCKSIHHKVTKVYFNDFVANVLSDNMGMLIFYLLGCGGCQRPKTSYLGAHFETLTQCSVHPSVPVLLTKDSPRNFISYDSQLPYLEF